MKRSVNKILIMIWILIFGALEGCTGKIQPEIIEPSVSNTPSPTNTATQNSIVTQTKSPTFVPTASPTSKPTLNAAQFEEEVYRFLSGENQCSSPCIFGIVPGQTTLDEAQEIFKWLRSPLILSNYPDGDVYYKTNIQLGGEFKYIYVELVEKNGLVKNLLLGFTFPEYEEIPDTRSWKVFSPETIINTYGSPTKVNLGLHSVSEPGFAGTWYDMLLKYEDINLTIEYFHGITVYDDYIKACPISDKFEIVSIYLGKGLKYQPAVGIPLEKVTDLTIEIFSDLLKENSENSCFYISTDAMFSP